MAAMSSEIDVCSSAPSPGATSSNTGLADISVVTISDNSSLVIAGQLIRRPCPKDLSVIYYIRSVGNRQSLADIMIGDQYADAALAQLLQDALYINHRNRVNPGKRLVEQNESRFDHQAPCNLRSAPLAAR